MQVVSNLNRDVQSRNLQPPPLESTGFFGRLCSQPQPCKRGRSVSELESIDLVQLDCVQFMAE